MTELSDEMLVALFERAAHMLRVWGLTGVGAYDRTRVRNACRYAIEGSGLIDPPWQLVCDVCHAFGVKPHVVRRPLVRSEYVEGPWRASEARVPRRLPAEVTSADVLAESIRRTIGSLARVCVSPSEARGLVERGHSVCRLPLHTKAWARDPVFQWRMTQVSAGSVYEVRLAKPSGEIEKWEEPESRDRWAPYPIAMRASIDYEPRAEPRPITKAQAAWVERNIMGRAEDRRRVKARALVARLVAR